jgi:hypothetical protein
MAKSLLKRLGCWNLNDSCVLRFQLRQAVSTVCVTWEVRGGGAGGKARTGEQGGQRVATHPLSRFVTLHSPRSPRPMLAMEGGALSLFFALRTYVTACSCRDAHLPHPAERRGGRTAPMAMPSRYVGIEHVSIRFTAPHARSPLGSRSTRLCLVITFHLLSQSPLLPRPHHFDPALRQSTKVRACFLSRPSCPWSSCFVVYQHRISVAHRPLFRDVFVRDAHLDHGHTRTHTPFHSHTHTSTLVNRSASRGGSGDTGRAQPNAQSAAPPKVRGTLIQLSVSRV